MLANNQNSFRVSDMNSITEMQPRFHKLVGFLRSFGFKGEIFLKAGMLIIAAYDKNSASMIRSALKKAPSAKLGTTAEVRNKTGGAAFVWVDDELAINKSEARELLIAA